MTGKLTQEFSVPLRVGDRVTLFDEVDIDKDGGFVAGTMFEDTVEQYSPQTGLLRFENSDVGRADFKDLLDEAEGIQIV
jgi:hypothetical protein